MEEGQKQKYNPQVKIRTSIRSRGEWKQEEQQETVPYMSDDRKEME